MSKQGGYDFYLGDVRFPVTPESYVLKVRGKNKTMTLINEGEINLLKLPGLTEINAEFLLPARDSYLWAIYPNGFQPPERFTDLLEQLKVNDDLDRRTTQFIIVRSFLDGTPQVNTNIKVSVEDYEIKQSQKDGFDFVISVKFLQYRDPVVRTVDVEIPQYERAVPVVTVQTQREQRSAPKNKSYPVAQSDTMSITASKDSTTGAAADTLFGKNIRSAGGWDFGTAETGNAPRPTDTKITFAPKNAPPNWGSLPTKSTGGSS